MLPQFLFWLLLTLFIAFIALGAASCSYFTMRAIENRNRDVGVILNITILWAIVLALGLDESFRRVFPLVVIAALCGFKFHQHSGGISESSGYAFLFMLVTAIVTVAIEIFVWTLAVNWLLSLPITLSSSCRTSSYFFLFLSYASIPLPPFLLWLHQNLRLRPGIDRHLDPETSTDWKK